MWYIIILKTCISVLHFSIYIIVISRGFLCCICLLTHLLEQVLVKHLILFNMGTFSLLSLKPFLWTDFLGNLEWIGFSVEYCKQQSK